MDLRASVISDEARGHCQGSAFVNFFEEIYNTLPS
jgi:hypothetical protein